jgi:hypothetical protein
MKDEKRIGRHGDTIPASPMSKDAFTPTPRIGDAARDDREAKVDQAARAFENRFPGFVAKERANAKRVEDLERGRAIAAFRQRYPGVPLPAELAQAFPEGGQ